MTIVPPGLGLLADRIPATTCRANDNRASGTAGYPDRRVDKSLFRHSDSKPMTRYHLSRTLGFQPGGCYQPSRALGLR